MNKQIEALEMSIKAMETSKEAWHKIGIYDAMYDGLVLSIQACKEALAEAEKQEKEAQQDAEAWLKQLNNELKNDDAKLNLEEGRKIMRALEALKEKNHG